MEFERNNPSKKYKEIVFGGRHNLKNYMKGLISKEEYRRNKLIPMMISGETRHKGNRLFDL